MERVHEKLIFLTVYSIKYCDSKSYTYLISKRSENLVECTWYLMSISTHSIPEIDTTITIEIEGIHTLENWKIRTAIPSRSFPALDSPQPWKGPRDFSEEKHTLRLRTRHVRVFSSSNACMLIYAIFSLWEERQNGARHPFPTFNLNIRRVFYLRPWMGQVCSDAEKKEDDTYRWPLIFHGKEC